MTFEISQTLNAHYNHGGGGGGGGVPTKWAVEVSSTLAFLVSNIIRNGFCNEFSARSFQYFKVLS